jgi:hypothetical protein
MSLSAAGLRTAIGLRGSHNPPLRILHPAHHAQAFGAGAVQNADGAYFHAVVFLFL